MHLTRRFFLQSSGALTVGLCLTPKRAWAGAKAAGSGKTLVILFLRGGADGLNLVVPHGDAHYYKARGDFAVAKPGEENGALDLDGFFGLHPAAAPLGPLFKEGTACALHAIGHAKNTRSHFEEQDVWETGVVENTIRSDGWLNRHLATCEGKGIVRAISIGDALPRILRGKQQAVAVRGLEDLTLPPDEADAEKALAALERAYAKRGGGEAEELLAKSGGQTVEAMKALRKIATQKYEPAVKYPETDLARRFQEVARLIKADVGLEVAEIDFGGWDTHQDQGTIGGPYEDLVRTMSGALAAFAADLEKRLDDVLVLTLSDFGRTVKPNGTNGTDHGWGNFMMALGGPVARAGGGKPRKTLADWPGLEPDRLYEERDLAHTRDFRDVLAEAVRGHLGNDRLDKILPGHEPKKVGLLS